MLRVIDRSNGVVIQKVITPRGKCLGYQVTMEGAGDSGAVQRFDTLALARAANPLFGHTVKHMELTKPKSECPHNQPGYRADHQTAKKRRV